MTKSVAVPFPVMVGGHICLDVIPALRGEGFGLAPGKLMNIGQAVLAAGGAVANTGLALHRLGIPVQPMGKIGDDIFGHALLSIFRNEQDSLANEMIISAGESTSYSIVLSPPATDRMFLHYTGANDTFGSEDVKAGPLADAGLFHFGYPPLMRRMYENGGTELISLMKRAKSAGATTSLDLAMPDPDAAAGRQDWKSILGGVLPYVDLFLPSIEELLFMLRREQYDQLLQKHGNERLIEYVDSELLRALSSDLLAMGAAVVVLKLGEHGLYMRTTAVKERFRKAGRYCPKHDEWLARELYIPCFNVEAAGTTGAGDCAIAGFLAGFIQGLKPEQVLIGAAATGACSVERMDATSGIPPWDNVRLRVASGWRQHEPKPFLEGYRANDQHHAVVYQSSWDGISNPDHT
ncbi:carbohydrate kinase family protein [Paenibacillus azoreducens]|uniref:Adenosine kinase n=1 Tax=Paenibacillus azoreducens TaxID=116718 RepID=A0A919Y784_9BACL|nr:carbohydrate kinase family protein [Paenibacillus azoreducens]GIO46236.1 adenosine kinase [Paenibacillus azoreducens]